MKNLKKIKIGKTEIVIGVELAAMFCIATLLLGGATAIQTATAHSYYKERILTGTGQFNINGIVGAVTVYETKWSADWWDTAVTYDTVISVHDVYANSIQVGLFVNDKIGTAYGGDTFYIKISGTDNYNSFQTSIQVGNFYGQQQQFAALSNGQSWEIMQFKNGNWQTIFTHQYSYPWSGCLAECYTEGQHQMKNSGPLTSWSYLSILINAETWIPFEPINTYPDYNWNPNLWTWTSNMWVYR